MSKGNKGIEAKDRTNTFANRKEDINRKGYPKGVKNRSTVAKQILSLAILRDADLEEIKSKYPDIAGVIDEEMLITIKQLEKARTEADTIAYKALMDSAYGAPKQEIQSENTSVIEYKNVSKQFPDE